MCNCKLSLEIEATLSDYLQEKEEYPTILERSLIYHRAERTHCSFYKTSVWINEYPKHLWVLSCIHKTAGRKYSFTCSRSCCHCKLFAKKTNTIIISKAVPIPPCQMIFLAIFKTLTFCFLLNTVFEFCSCQFQPHIRWHSVLSTLSYFEVRVPSTKATRQEWNIGERTALYMRWLPLRKGQVFYFTQQSLFATSFSPSFLKCP